MEKRTENKIRMFDASLGVLNDFKTVWQNNAGFTEVTNELTNGVADIKAMRSQTGTSTNGITDAKEVVYDDLIDSTMELAGPLVSLAKRMNNNELKNKVKCTDSDLKSLTENALVQRAKDLATEALKYKEGLARYNVTEQQITDLDNLANQFGAMISGPREVVSVRVSAKISLNQLIRNISTLLKEELDGLVEQYRRSNPDFGNAYFTARKIVDYGIRHEKKTEATAKS